jgi:hypothetical protein
MLKSQSTQLACTLLFGPLGLAYISMASAVMLTLLTVVLYFTLLGPVAIVGMWPVAIVLGALAVHLSNVQQRNIGMNLLLTDDRRSEEVKELLAAGARFAAIAVFIGGAAFGVYRYGTSAADKAVDSMAQLAEQTGVSSLFAEADTLQPADDSETTVTPVASVDSATIGVPATQSEAVAIALASGPAPLPSVALPQEQPDVVVLPASSMAPKAAPQRKVRKVPSAPLVKVARRDRFVKQAIANLRSGPGTGHSIVDIARKGDRLVQLARQGNWVQVQLASSDRTAWIFGGLLKR